MKTILLCTLIGLAMLVGCTRAKESEADLAQRERTDKMMEEAHSQIGMPAIKNFQERKLAKMIFELRDREDLVCYAYLKSDYTGQLIYLGKCLGFGLPYSVQYTNPMRPSTYRYCSGSYDMAILPQPDPNGLFMPEGLSATWLMMIDPETNEPRPVYVEPEIVVSPFPLH